MKALSPLKAVVVSSSLALLCAAGLAHAQSSQTIYSDSLQNGWQDWGWAPHNYTNASPFHLATPSVSVTISDASYQGLQLYHPDMSSTPYANLTFWINGGPSGGQHLHVYGLLDANGQANQAQNGSFSLPTLPANTWQLITVPLTTLGVANRANFTGFVIQDSIGAIQSTFYVDDISLVPDTGASVTLTAPANGSSYTAPASISMTASVVTNSQTINKVQFFNGATLLGEDTTAPYSFLWTNVSAGNYSVSASVVFNTTNSSGSGSSSILVSGVVPVSITVDAHLNQRAISPFVYGTAFASASQLSDLNIPLNRSGGNSETRYNWMIDAHNHAADFYFESIADSSGTPAASDDNFIGMSKSGGAQPAITIPMIGWVPVLGANRSKLASYSTNKYGPQTSTDSNYFPEAGNGISVTNKTPITWNTKTDANMSVTVTFQQNLVQHFLNTWGNATNGGVRYYLLDNEHSIWHSTHQDVHPVGATMQEIYNDITNYAAMLKQMDSNAMVLGPEEWGWGGYFNSGYDQQWAGAHGDYTASHFPDRTTNGGLDYMPWLLDKLHQYEISTGRRLLDYFTLHCYPQEGNVFAAANDNTTQLLRNASTRQFWDTSYVDPSWINSVIMLIPRMKAWVNQYYPGTKIGITEYNWGAESYMNGATAQADLFGIFGREGVDLATRWTTPDTGTPTYLAMKMYRNYDGNKSTFGDLSVSASGPNPDNVSTFAALRSADGALTVMVINKQSVFGGAVSMTINNFALGGAAKVWQLTGAGTIAHLADLTLVGNTLNASVPAQSITLFVLPPGAQAAPQLKAAAVTASNNFSFSLNGSVGLSYILQSSTDLVNWIPVFTNVLTNVQYNFVLPMGGSTKGFYRAKLGP